jgi:hypothetical protein
MNGEWQTELQIHHGKPPKVGSTVQVTLGHVTVIAGVTGVTVPASKGGGDRVFRDSS